MNQTVTRTRTNAPMLEQLQRRFPLPPGWVPELWGDVVKIGGLALHAVGIAAQNSRGQTMTGSAVALRRSPVERAYFELLERLSALEASNNRSGELLMFDGRRRAIGNTTGDQVFPQSPRSEWRYSVSNGIALHRTWSQATAHAYFELIERDRVLRSWYGQMTPKRIAVGLERLSEQLRGLYELEAYEFDASPRAAVVGVFAFPQLETAPLAYGFAARTSTGNALERAVGECLQALAFLWEERLPAEPPRPTPTPDFHQEHYLCRRSHARLRAWLGGEHQRFRVSLRPRRARRRARFVDLTPPWLKGARVAKALPDGELPLVFGRGSPVVAAELPEAMAVHPIK